MRTASFTEVSLACMQRLRALCLTPPHPADVKPSNILVNSQGQIKICDFGVSGEVINSIADTFVGTSTYMSVSGASLHPSACSRADTLTVHTQPERIQGDQYSVKSDVWSLGISVIELALGRFPFAESSDSDEDDDEVPEELRGTLSPTRPEVAAEARAAARTASGNGSAKKGGRGVSLEGSGAQMSILDLLQHIVNEAPPRLPVEGGFPKPLDDFVNLCLVKEPAKRPSPKDLTKHSYVVEQESAKVDLLGWVNTLV